MKLFKHKPILKTVYGGGLGPQGQRFAGAYHYDRLEHKRQLIQNLSLKLLLWCCILLCIIFLYTEPSHAQRYEVRKALKCEYHQWKYIFTPKRQKARYKNKLYRLKCK